MHAIGANAAGHLASVVAGGVLLALLSAAWPRPGGEVPGGTIGAGPPVTAGTAPEVGRAE